VRYERLKTVIMQNNISRDVTPCNLLKFTDVSKNVIPPLPKRRASLVPIFLIRLYFANNNSVFYRLIVNLAG
jgi:hypothetical protein